MQVRALSLVLIISFLSTLPCYAMDDECTLKLQESQLIEKIGEEFRFNNGSITLQRLLDQCNDDANNPFNKALLYALAGSNRFVSKGRVEEQKNDFSFLKDYSSFLFVVYCKGKQLLHTYALFLGAREQLSAKRIEQIVLRAEDQNEKTDIRKSQERKSPLRSPLSASRENIPMNSNSTSLKKSQDRIKDTPLDSWLLPLPGSSAATWKRGAISLAVSTSNQNWSITTELNKSDPDNWLA